jgi:hypothetical protein
MSREAVKHIKTWHERCEEHPDHQERIISERMIQARMQEEIDELRQALETEQKPVAWMHTTGTGHVYFRKKPQDKVYSPQPVYTAPPKKQWVGLTDEEIQDLGYLSEKFDASNSEYFDRWGFARAIEQALKEKNQW